MIDDSHLAGVKGRAVSGGVFLVWAGVYRSKKRAREWRKEERQRGHTRVREERMSQKELCNKAAHLAGFTSLAFFPGMERKVATVGADSFIKVHRLEADEDAITEIEHFENVVNAVAVSRDGTTIVAGGEDREVALFKVNKDGEYDFEKLVARSSVDIRELHFSPTSNLVAVASDDKDIHVVNADAVEEVKILSGHRGGVKTVRFDPKGKFIASTGADATLRVWDVASGEEVFIVERVFDQAKANKVAEGTGALLNRCAVAWSHDGLLLAVGGGSDVRVYARDSWEEKESFTGGDASAQISTVQFSRNGCYLLTVNTAGVALAWDVLSRATVGRRLENAAGNKLQLAVWDPDFNAVAVVGTDGSYGLVGDIIGSDKLGPHEMLDDDDEDAESFGAGAEDDEEGGELILDDPLEASGGGASRAPGKSAGYARQARYEPEVEAQPAFQPQSTPMEGKRRFMAYTYDGFITCRADRFVICLPISPPHPSVQHAALPGLDRGLPRPHIPSPGIRSLISFRAAPRTLSRSSSPISRGIDQSASTTTPGTAWRPWGLSVRPLPPPRPRRAARPSPRRSTTALSTAGRPTATGPSA